MAEKKYALLDTDFISKMHTICGNEGDKLIERVLALPDYQFYCHSQVQKELSDHSKVDCPGWLEQKIAEGVIQCVDDGAILTELEEVCGTSATAMYAQFLKTACDAYASDYFDDKFTKTAQVDPIEVTKEKFLDVLGQDCDAIGRGKSLGELKSYVLLQELQFMHGENIYVFCSDDRDARSGATSIGGAVCVSVLSSFLRLKEDGGLTKTEAEPYIQAFVQMCHNTGQTTFRVVESSHVNRIMRVNCEQVLNEIFDDRFNLLPNGNLKYK